MPHFRSLMLSGIILCSFAVVADSVIAQQANVDRLLADGHYLRAEPLVRAAVQRNPNDAHALVNLSILDWAFNRLDASLADTEKAVAAVPDSVEANSKLTNALGSKLLSSDAGTLAKISLARRFRKAAERTLELDPKDVDALQDLAEFHWHAPGMVGGDKSKAREMADRLFAISAPRGAAARADFASDEPDAGKRSRAVQEIWRNAVTVAPNSYEAHAELAASYLEGLGDPSSLPAAEAAAKRALALDPSRAAAYNSLAIVYARTNRWSDLEVLLKKAAAAVPENRGPGYRAAVAILNGNIAPQLQRAEQLLREYLAQPAEGQEPSHARAHWRLGQVLERQGRKADAVREFQTALSQDSSLDGAKKDLKRLS